MNHPSGNLKRYSPEDLELAIDWPEDRKGLFISSLIGNGFLDEKNGIFVHDWGSHNPYASRAELRSEIARKGAIASNIKKYGKEGSNIDAVKKKERRSKSKRASLIGEKSDADLGNEQEEEEEMEGEGEKRRRGEGVEKKRANSNHQQEIILCVESWNKVSGQSLKWQTYADTIRSRMNADPEFLEKFKRALDLVPFVDDSKWSNRKSLTWLLRPGKGEPPTIDRVLDGQYEPPAKKDAHQQKEEERKLINQKVLEQRARERAEKERKE